MSDKAKRQRRNPGPSWGYSFINMVSRVLPWPVMKFVLKISSLVSLVSMKEQRRHSRNHLRTALGREPSWVDCWKHFSTFAEFLVRRFDAAGGSEPDFESMNDAEIQMKKMADDKEQAFYGTFHFGDSDLMGFWLSHFDVSIRMVRFQMENAKDLKWLEEQFGEKIGFLWVNKPEDFLFSLKNAVEDGHCIAVTCDRIENSSKLETFNFMGARRWFPFTIYHLSVLFNLPVVFSFGLPNGRHKTQVYSSEIFRPLAGSKKENLANARIHFQDTLNLLEGLVMENPYQWFNFLDAVPIVVEGEDAPAS